MTTKGALLTILGEFDRAMSVLNEVLRNDSSHYLALMRRSQLYKKVALQSLRRASSIELSKTWSPSPIIVPITYNLQPCVFRSKTSNSAAKTRIALKKVSRNKRKMRKWCLTSAIWRKSIASLSPSTWISARAEWPSVATQLFSTKETMIMRRNPTPQPPLARHRPRKSILKHSDK